MKYKLTDETRELNGVTLYRIQATRNFGRVQAGAKGGWVEQEYNLSQQSACWIADDAVAMGAARVKENGQLTERAIAMDRAIIGDNARLADDARASGWCCVGGNAYLFDQAHITESAVIEGDTEMCGMSVARGSALIFQGAHLLEQADVSGSAKVGGYARVTRGCTTSPVHFMGLNYHITIQDEDMTIGCKTMSLDKWARLKPAVAARLDTDNPDTEKLWEEYQDAILAMARSAGRVFG